MSSGVTRTPVIANMPDCPVAELPARTPAEQAQWRGVLGLGTAAAADVSAFAPAGIAGIAADPGTITIPSGSVLVQYNRMILSGTNRITLQGTARIVLTDLNPQTVLYLGTPRVVDQSFTVRTNNDLEVNGRLTLSGNNRITLQGTARIILTDDFGSRSRIVLSGKGG